MSRKLTDFIHMETEEGRGYCFVGMFPDSAKMVRDWAINDCELDPESVYPVDSYHCTLIYDRSNPKNWSIFPSGPEMYVATITGFEVFGDKGAMVIMLECHELAERHRFLLVNGYKSDYATYNPHVTFKTGATSEEIRRTRANLDRLIGREISFFGEEWEKIDGEWDGKP